MIFNVNIYFYFITLLNVISFKYGRKIFINFFGADEPFILAKSTKKKNT